MIRGVWRGTLLLFTILLIVPTVPAACPISLADYGVTGDGSDEGYEVETAFAYATANAPCKVIFPDAKTILFGNQLTTGTSTEIDGMGSTISLLGFANATTQSASATTAALVSRAYMNVSAAESTVSSFKGMLV